MDLSKKERISMCGIKILREVVVEFKRLHLKRAPITLSCCYDFLTAVVIGAKVPDFKATLVAARIRSRDGWFFA